jgi:PKD repeat protein
LAQFAGDLGYESSNGNENVIVNSTPTSLTTQVKTAYYNTTVALTATLRDAIKNAVMFGKTVNFKVNDVLVGSAVTNAQGIATFNYIAAIMPGVYQILAEFDATTEYNFSNGTNNLNVNYNPTNLNVAPKSGNHNGIVDLTATLRDTLNNLISGQTVYFSVNNTSVGSAVTNELGVATYQYTITLGEGIYPINVEFLGDGGYNATSGLNNLTVSKTSTNMTVNPISGYYGDLVDLTATLTDNLHSVPIEGRTVNFFVNNIQIGSALTDLSGVATVSNYIISQNAGIYSILAQFEGDTGFSPSENSSSFMVNYIPISIVVEQVFGRTGDLVNLIATVTDLHNNLPVSGLNLNFTVNNNPQGIATTNASGVSTFPYAITLNQGSYIILAQFLQDYIYSGSTGTGTLIVNFPIPVASFTATPTSGRGPLTVKFTSTSTGTIDKYAWDFNGDGKVDSTLRNPSYTYTKAGVYTVKLTVTGPGGTRTQTRTKYINVKLPDIQMNSVYASTTVRRGNNIRIINRVRNIGTISTGSFYVGFYLKMYKTSTKKYYLGRRYLSSLKAGYTSLRTNYFRVSNKIPRGRYYILAVADYTKRVREISRANNLKYTTTKTRIT